MKRGFAFIGLLLGVAGLGLTAQAATTPQVSTQFQHIANTLNAPNSIYPDCSTSVTSSCLAGYTFVFTPPTNTGNSVTVPVSNGGIGAGGQFAYTWGPGGFLYCGTWGVSVVANFLDQPAADGSVATVVSSADTTTATVQCPLSASPATGLKATPAP